jgi:hypothetical protein
VRAGQWTTATLRVAVVAAVWPYAGSAQRPAPAARPAPVVSHRVFLLDTSGRGGLIFARVDASVVDTLVDVITCGADSIRLYAPRRPGLPERPLGEAATRPREPLFLSATGVRARLFGLKTPVRAGDSIDVVFSFARAGLVRQWLRVTPRPPSVATALSQRVAAAPRDPVAAFIAELRSPFCDDALLRDCPTPEAAGLRDEIAQRLRAGEPVAQLRAQLVARHGPMILAARQPARRPSPLTAPRAGGLHGST